MSDFSAKLKKLLREKGMTQRQLARNLETTDKAVSRWCRGITIPKKKTVERIETTLGLDRGTLKKLIEEGKAQAESDHIMSTREEKILKAWKRGERTPEEVAKITGYTLEIVGRYLPLGIEKEYT